MTMHAHEIVREFQRIFGGTEVEYALHTDDLTLDRIAVRVAGWPSGSVAGVLVVLVLV